MIFFIRLVSNKNISVCHSRAGGNPEIEYTVLGIQREVKMKRILFLLPFIAFFTISFMFFVGCNNHKPTKEQYELQERCGKRCEEWMKSYQQKFLREEFTYKNHYNKKLNKCFIYKSSLLGVNQVFTLNDVNENKEYGSCVGTLGDEDSFLCGFLGKDIKGKKEWDKIVKPYMEE